MSKYQEALNFVFGYALDGSLNDSESNMVREKVSILQELVDGKTAMKPAQHVHSKTKETYYECRRCGITGITPANNYCPECGQKLDWIDSQ